MKTQGPKNTASTREKNDTKLVIIRKGSSKGRAWDLVCCPGGGVGRIV